MRWLLVLLAACHGPIAEDDFFPIDDALVLPDAPPPLPDACTPLDENTCLDTAGCHATYAVGKFIACARVDGPRQDGTCAQQGEQACGFRDDCVSMVAGPGPQSMFQSCADEPNANTLCDLACNPGMHCELACDDVGGCIYPSCYPGGDGCGSATCTTTPPSCIRGSVPAVANGCFTGTCMPTSECP